MKWPSFFTRDSKRGLVNQPKKQRVDKVHQLVQKANELYDTIDVVKSNKVFKMRRANFTVEVFDFSKTVYVE